MLIKPFFSHDNRANQKARIAIFMSGTGTNAKSLLEYERSVKTVSFESVLIFTDAPQTSRAAAIAEQYGLPLIALDIRKFYQERGETTIALTSPQRCQIRDEWTEALRRLIEPYKIDFIVLAGFVPLCNITADYPCLNVHPGDLTIEENGQRLLVGLHFRPVETAILRGFKELRSSVILAQPFKENGVSEMDSGPVLGISAPITVQLGDCTIKQLSAIYTARQQPPYTDKLREVAAANLERLKFAGDHILLPRVVDDFAANKFGWGDGKLHYLNSDLTWIPVRTVQYSEKKAQPIQL